MKLAVLSDVHGKDEKLRSIAGKLSAADKILFLGDLFTEDDDPNACWELLTQLHTDVWIMGNTDEWLCEDYDVSTLNALCRQEALEAKAKMNPITLKAIQKWNKEKKFKLDSCSILCVHDYPMTDSLSAMKNKVYSSGADLILCGHTHKPALLRFENKMIINPGAVCEGQYVLIEIEENIESIEFISF